MRTVPILLGGCVTPVTHWLLRLSPCLACRSLEWVIEDDVDPGRAATLLCRKITQRLPSFGEAFTQQVPLTRIRDIAHRGDIPHVSLFCSLPTGCSGLPEPCNSNS